MSKAEVLLSCVFTLASPLSAWASRGSNQEGQAPMQPQPPSSEAAQETTDPGSLRARLQQLGVQLTVTYYGDALGNPSGGVHRGLRYEGRLRAIVDADLDRLTGWSGATFHASLHQIHGTGLSAANLENLMVVSGIEAPAATRLFNLWVEQAFGDKASLRLGQFTAAQEFLVSQSANLFVNSTFGWPVITAANLPSGGPAYPEATPGARLKLTPHERLTLMAAIFDGDPAGPGPGNPAERDPSGTAFRVSDPPLIIAEMAYAYHRGKQAGPQTNPNQEGSGERTSAQPSPSAADATESGLPGSIKAGAWFHTGSFADQRFDTAGGPLAASSSQPLRHAGDVGFYAVFDQRLWRAGGGASDRGLSCFLRVSAAPSDRNLIDRYLDLGLTWKGPIASRPDDTLGIGLAFGRVSPRAAARDRELVALTGMPMPIRDHEAAIELTYQWQLAQHWALQPDVQYIDHPGGHVPDPLDSTGASAIRNATVLGMRALSRF